jgi:hypothetical protein
MGARNKQKPVWPWFVVFAVLGVGCCGLLDQLFA